jgi:5-methylcytosine-specific restriction endonuclease McrA
MEALESVGAIRLEGDANRDGTLYRVMLPEEIGICQERRQELSVRATPVQVHEGEVDYYNVRENRSKVYERDSYKCRYCDKQLTRFTVTLDHVKSVRDGGDNSFENLVAACLVCNSKKNQRLVGDFIADG